ncbi:ionotropic receptor 21a-like [Oratosquilla oratoria]|uniref:ionotropic receptor 21a-like n=1 Tax=Oratosquilla oratoria TaxID=337810 RepID=UPI003F772533
MSFQSGLFLRFHKAMEFHGRDFCIFLKKLHFVLLLILLTSFSQRGTGLELNIHRDDEIEDRFGALRAVVDKSLEEAEQPLLCSTLAITDGASSHQVVRKLLNNVTNQRGVSVTELQVPLNETVDDSPDIVKVLQNTRKCTFTVYSVITPLPLPLRFQVRLASWCLTMVVVSDDVEFLEWLARAIQDERVLVWNTRLVVLSRIPNEELLRLLRGHWTFSMMTSVFVNRDPANPDSKKFQVYSYHPYTPKGSSIVRLASWSRDKGLSQKSEAPFFGEKFLNFHGSKINVTALPYPPYWDERIEDGKLVIRGMDYFMLESIAQSLNFRFSNIPTKNWDEVTERVQERVSFLATVFHVVFPHRRLLYDYSFTYEYSLITFGMAKPALKPQWQSMYYPLADEVWVLIVAMILLVPLPLHLDVTEIARRQPEYKVNYLGGLSRAHRGRQTQAQATSSLTSVDIVIGTLLGQNLRRNLPTNSSYRFLLTFWLVFAFIVGTAYRGNLTASLTLPKYPPRAETLAELVRTGASVGMPPYGAHFQRFFAESTSLDFQTIARRFLIVPTAADGLDRALRENFACMDPRRYMQLQIARKFTRADGTTGLYIAREDAFPGLSGWPFPHDAPYKHVFDHKIMSVIEGGLYEKWNRDMVALARKEGRLQARREALERKEKGEEDINNNEEKVFALTLKHMQGPLLLLVLGWVIAAVVFGHEAILRVPGNLDKSASKRRSSAQKSAALPTRLVQPSLPTMGLLALGLVGFSAIFATTIPASVITFFLLQFSKQVGHRQYDKVSPIQTYDFIVVFLTFSPETPEDILPHEMTIWQ